jgi:hypothetical protein
LQPGAAEIVDAVARGNDEHRRLDAFGARQLENLKTVSAGQSEIEQGDRIPNAAAILKLADEQRTAAADDNMFRAQFHHHHHHS